MYCKHCGKQIDNDSIFCLYCGKEQHNQQENTQLESETFVLENEKRESSEDVIFEKEHKTTSFTTKIIDKREDKHIAEANVEHKNAWSSTPKKSKGRAIYIITLVIIILVFVAVPFFSNIFNGFHREFSATEIAKLSDSVLTLYVYDKNHDLLSTGSGFVVNDDKTIVTNYHVIEQGYFVEAVSEKDVHYNIVGATFFDEDDDIAILKFETNTHIAPLVIEDSSTVHVGDTIYAIGSPLGLKNTVSNGIVSAIREEEGQTDIQITAPISTGSSGGVLLNIYGEVVGITYASYSDGQNLNLAIPSIEFKDKLQDDEIQQFENITLYTRPLGNSIANYSSNEARLVQYGNSIYESYNSDNEITYYDINTKKSKKLGINGTNLSIYRGILYYISSNSTIGTYNISTGEVCKDILSSYPPNARVDTISGLYISNYGISVIYDVGFFETALVQLDFNGEIIGNIDKLPDGIVVADADTLVGYDYENWELEFIYLSDLKNVSIPVDFKPGAICADEEGYLYISNGSETAYVSCIKYNLYTGEYTRIYKNDAATYGCSVYNKKIFYPSTNGTKQKSVNGTEVETISNTYMFLDMCFSDDEKIYAIGRYPKDALSAEYIKYYICANFDGTQLEILDSEEIK